MSTRAARILIVEDDPDIRHLVTDLMEREGFTVEEAGDVAAAEAAIARRRPDVVILDLMLPGEDGLSFCRRLRAHEALPILMLTAKSDEIDRVLGLEMGADDYLVKPFGPRELVARVRVILRRGQSPAPLQSPSRRLGFAGFVIDIDARELTTDDGQAIPLTTGEFDLLSCFVQRPRRVLTRDQILDWTHGRAADPFDRTVDMLVSRLRRKLGAARPDVTLITTIRNGGYLFVAAVKPVS